MEIFRKNIFGSSRTKSGKTSANEKPDADKKQQNSNHEVNPKAKRGWRKAWDRIREVVKEAAPVLKEVASVIASVVGVLTSIMNFKLKRKQLAH